jgi:hypothetical protein
MLPAFAYLLASPFFGVLVKVAPVGGAEFWYYLKHPQIGNDNNNRIRHLLLFFGLQHLQSFSIPR